MMRSLWSKILPAALACLLLAAGAHAQSADQTAYVSSWQELNAAAEAGKTEIIVTADIEYTSACRTVIFADPVTIRSAEGEHFTIDGSGRQILCVQSEDFEHMMDGWTTVRDLTFINGDATQYGYDLYRDGLGGALFVMGSLRVEHCTFSDNQAITGGAVYSAGESLVIDDCRFTGNAAKDGGALYVGYGEIRITDTDISGNTAEDDGGGIYAEQSSLAIESVSIYGNTAEKGGGVFIQTGDMVLTGNEISGNLAEDGGGVYVETGSVRIGGEGWVYGNIATYGDGGGIYIAEGNAEVTGGEITGNSAAQGDGGGLYLEEGNAEVTGGSVLCNTADYGGGIALWCGDLTLSGGEITGNTAIDSGGGVSIDDGNLLMTGGAITRNTAQYGGGVYASVYETAELTGGAVRGNAAEEGGGLYCYKSDVRIAGCEISANTATGAGGGLCMVDGSLTEEAGCVHDNAPDNVLEN